MKQFLNIQDMNGGNIPPEEEMPKEGTQPLHLAYVPKYQEDIENVVHYYNCPRCQKCISNKADETKKFCPYCGQKIDWTSTQEVE